VRAVAKRTDGYTHEVDIEGGHALVFDEPLDQGGNDRGPSPTRATAAALAACTAITVEMYAARKQWELGDVQVDVDLRYGRASSIEELTVTLKLGEQLTEEQQRKLLEIAGRCPIHRALTGETKVTVHDRIETSSPR
jgi:putative redox protein